MKTATFYLIISLVMNAVGVYLKVNHFSTAGSVILLGGLFFWGSFIVKIVRGALKREI
ncbi:hypothetical protein [Riemerella columbipharyngis]|uniref:Uncharacterized protein n=1 Tax=Riemerella columbipharyngis TaxID=1071918 RepID=A0A1G7C5N4_9FLAO|nr:hypothetical protein [Riemerella columbipharyngis]SDE34618.1 hypothetical protein SAMN05421544_10760 [Riemerella columbipharyngis]